MKGLVVEMYQSVRKLLEAYGYENITLNVVGISLGLKRVGDQGFAVVTVDETTGNLLTREQFEHISMQIREFIQKRGCQHTYFLYLLISEEDGSQNRLFGNQGNYWRIVPTRGRVMVFEDTVAEFMELRRPLEKLFPGGSAYQGNAGSGGFRRDGAYGGGYPGQGGGGSFAGRRWDAFRQYWRNNLFPRCNMIVVAINIAIFLITDLFLFSSANALVEWGALGWYEVLKEGEWYRLFTSMFMHGGIDHIFSNMLVLLYLGSCLEQQVGSVRYGVIYLGSGILAGFVSMGYNMLLGDFTVSIGASGAVFGVMGALLCLVIFFRDRAGDFNLRQMAVMVFFGLYGGFADQGVDNAAHVGGLIAGFLLTAVLMLLGREKK